MFLLKADIIWWWYAFKFFYHLTDDKEYDDQKISKGLETLLIEEKEASLDLEKSNEKSPAPQKPKRNYRRIVSFASSSSSSDSSDTENASFDLGAIKKKYTPRPRNFKQPLVFDEDENDYDLEDSFINDEDSGKLTTRIFVI